MKTVLFFLFAIFGINALAQDTLYTTQGKVINGKVTEVTQSEIKYKKTSNPDGPIYIIDKSEIVLIQYKNGSKDVFENSGTISSGSSNNSPNTVIVDGRPLVNLIVGSPLPYLAWGAMGWGWNRPYYYRGYRGYHHHSYHRHHGHFGHRGH